MRSSTLKITIEFHTHGLNTKEEHFSRGTKADLLFHTIKIHLDGVAVQTDIDSVLAAMSAIASVNDGGDDEDTRPWKAEDEKRIECKICLRTFEDWQSASCHLSEYHMYNCISLTAVPPETLTISALWFNIMSENMKMVSDKSSIETMFRDYVSKHSYDLTVDELTEGAYAKWWHALKKEK